MHSRLSSLQLVQHSPLTTMSHRTFLALHDWHARADLRLTMTVASEGGEAGLRLLDVFEISSSSFPGLCITADFLRQ